MGKCSAALDMSTCHALSTTPCRGNTFLGWTQSRWEIFTAEAFWMDGADRVPFPQPRSHQDTCRMSHSFHSHGSTVAQSCTDITLLYCERLLSAHSRWAFALHRRRCLGFRKEGWLTNEKLQDPLSSPEQLTQGSPFSETSPGVFYRDQ